MDFVKEGQADLAKLRVLFVANGLIPSLTLQFIRPLSPWTASNRVALELLSEQELTGLFGRPLNERAAMRWISGRMGAFKPHVVVFCRYSGPLTGYMLDTAHALGAATIFQIDDDLLNVPQEFGAAKYAFHNAPERLAAIRYLLSKVDLVSFSNTALMQRFSGEQIGGQRFVHDVFAASEVICAHPTQPGLTIGYMGIDHASDFQLVVPALVNILRKNPQVSFELFGPMAIPDVFKEFGDRARSLPLVKGYEAFIQKFCSLGWSIGICALQDTHFNRVKTHLKWVEYTAIGAAVVASAGLFYDDCCADGCGVLVGKGDSWERALQALIDDPRERRQIVRAAQARLVRDYSLDAQRASVSAMFAQVSPLARHALA